MDRRRPFRGGLITLVFVCITVFIYCEKGYRRVNLCSSKEVSLSWNSETSELHVTGSGTMTSRDSSKINDYMSMAVTVHIGAGIRSIYDKTFQGWWYLQTVSFEAGSALKKISARSFYQSALEVINIPKGIETIGDYAFYSCSQLKSITTEVLNVREIGKYAFYLCKRMTFPETPELTSFGEYALSRIWFTECTISPKVTVLPAGLFCYCEKLETVTCTRRIERIPNEFFYACINLKTINIDLTHVTYVGESAFAYCGMDTLSLPALQGQINSQVFAGSKLTSMTIPGSVTEIGEGAFRDCVCLTSITILGSVTEIGNQTFCNCSSLTSVIFEKEFTVFRNGVFAGCVKLDLSGITGVDWSKVTNIGENCFRGSGLTEITIYSSTTIEKGAFAECPLQTVNVNGDYTTLPDELFSRCTKLTTIPYSSQLVSLGSSVFSDSVLTEFTIPPTFRTFGARCFYNCMNLKRICVNGSPPDGSISIGDHAFDNCQSLEMWGVSMDAVKEMGQCVFSSCNRLVLNITLKHSIEFADSAFERSGITQITLAPTTADEETTMCAKLSLCNSMFSRCSSLKSVIYKAVSACQITSIGSYMFYQCWNLETVDVLQFSVQSIGDYAFYGCSSVDIPRLPNIQNIGVGAFEQSCIVRARIPDSITSIGERAFQSCMKLKFLTFPNKDLKIPANFACGCCELKTVSIPPKITSIGDSAFKMCCTLTTVELHANLNIGNYAFQDCLKLSDIKIDCESIGSSSFSNCHSLKKVDIYVSIVRKNMFQGASSLTEVTLGPNVTTIEDYVFDQCHNLRSIKMDKDSCLKQIGNYAFRSCANLEEIEFKESLQKIGHYAFFGCLSLKTNIILPTAVALIGKYAFSEAGVTSLILGSCDSLYSSAFNKCPNLVSVELRGKLRAVGSYLFASCPKLKVVVVGFGVSSLGDYMFYDCPLLTDVTLPKGVSTPMGVSLFARSGLTSFVCPSQWWALGERMFESCRSLTHVTLTPGIDTIEPYVFANSGVKEIVISEGVPFLGRCMFYMCTDLENIDIPTSVTKIGQECFYGCSKLNIQLSASITSIGMMAFAYTAITHFTIHSGVSYNTGVISNCDIEELTIPSSLTNISAGLLSGLTRLKKVTLPPEIQCIKQKAFCGCTELEEVILPETVTNIDSYAFANMTKLKRMRIPPLVVSIGNYVFANCTSLSEIEFSNMTSSLTMGKGLFYGCELLKTVVLPQGSQISDYMFEHWHGVTTWQIEDSITTIGKYAFSYCTSLENITLHDNINEIGIFAFVGCTTLEKLIIPASLTIIPQGLACNCTSLKTIVLPDTVTEINADVFAGCELLNEVPFPSSVNLIAARVFQGCLGFVHYEVHENIREIEDHAFASCINLETVSLHDEITAIKGYAFYNCSKLKTIKIPLGVQSLTEYMFGWCCSLETVTLHSGVGQAQTGVFSHCHSLVAVDLHDTQITDIPDEMFQHCHSLVNITFSNLVETIGEKSFMECHQLESMNVSEMLDIGSYAFCNCTSLKEFTGCVNSSRYMLAGCTSLVSIVQSGSSCKEGTYENCTGLCSVEFLTAPVFGPRVFYGCTSLEHITWAEAVNVQELPESLFEGCSSLRELNESLLVRLYSIGSCAFKNCVSLEKIAFGNEYAVECCLGDGVFEGCISLREVTLHRTWYFSGAGANLFRNCINLRNVSLPNGIETFGPYMFYNCTSLTLDGIEVGNSVTSYQEGVFGAWSQLTEFSVQDYGMYMFKVPDEMLIDCINVEIVHLNENIVAIGTRAFKGCTKLARIDLPSGLISLGEGVFMGCENLVEVVLPKNVMNIPSNLFAGCKKLSRCEMSDSVAAIESGVFMGCESLARCTLPNTLPKISNSLFAGCTKLVGVTLPKKITELPDELFLNCVLLSQISIPVGVVVIGNSVFENCTKLQRILLPSNVRQIGDYAFAGCSFESISLPSKVTNITVGMFSRCSQIQSFSVPDHVNEIHSSAFEGCTNMVSFTIPSGIQEYAARILMNCRKLVHVEISSSVLYIRESAFRGCVSLSSITIPSSVKEISDFAFADTGLKNVNIPYSVAVLGNHIFANTQRLESISYCVSSVQCTDETFDNSVQFVSVPMNYLPTTVCGITAVRSDQACLAQSTTTWLLYIYSDYEKTMDFVEDATVMFEDVDGIIVDEMSINSDVSVTFLGSVTLRYKLAMGGGSSLVVEKGMSLEDDGITVIEMSLSSLYVPVMQIGNVTNSNLPHRIVIDIDNTDLSVDDMKSLTSGEKVIVTLSGSDSLCEKWKSKVLFVLQQKSLFSFSASCRRDDNLDIHEIVITGEQASSYLAMFTEGQQMSIISGSAGVLLIVVVPTILIRRRCRKDESDDYLESEHDLSVSEITEDIGDNYEGRDPLDLWEW